MLSSELYPVYLNLSRCRVLVAGFGKVGQRKVHGLLSASAGKILIADPADPGTLGNFANEMLADRRILYVQRPWQPEDLRGRHLAFAATASRKENLRLASCCRKAGIFCNLATDPEAGTFILPALARSGGLALAITTGGASPMLAAKWRRELQEWVDARQNLIWLMARLRELVLANPRHSGHAREIFEAFVNSELDTSLRARDLDNCRSIGLALLPAELHEGYLLILQEYENIFF